MPNNTPKVMVLTRQDNCVAANPSRLDISERQNNKIQLVAGAASTGPITLSFPNPAKLARIFDDPPPATVVLHPNPSDPSVAGLNARSEITMKLKSAIARSNGQAIRVRPAGSAPFSDANEAHAVTYRFEHSPGDCNPGNHEDWHIEC